MNGRLLGGIEIAFPQPNRGQAATQILNKLEAQLRRALTVVLQTPCGDRGTVTQLGRGTFGRNIKGAEEGHRRLGRSHTSESAQNCERE